MARDQNPAPPAEHQSVAPHAHNPSPADIIRQPAKAASRAATSPAVSRKPIHFQALSEVERTFRNLKDVIEMRPIYHQKKLKAAGLDLSASEALTALKTVRVVDIDLGDGKSKRCVTSGSQRATRILTVLGIKDRQVPDPTEQPKPQA